MSALAEFAGGIGLALGLLFPLPNAAIAASMLVAIALVHLPKGFFVSKGGYEFNLALIAAVAALALTGPGVYALDSALAIHLPEPISLMVATILVIVGVGFALLTRGPQPVAETKPQTT
jgi:putative oxidoreductase